MTLSLNKVAYSPPPSSMEDWYSPAPLPSLFEHVPQDLHQEIAKYCEVPALATLENISEAFKSAYDSKNVCNFFSKELKWPVPLQNREQIEDSYLNIVKKAELRLKNTRQFNEGLVFEFTDLLERVKEKGILEDVKLLMEVCEAMDAVDLWCEFVYKINVDGPRISRVKSIKEFLVLRNKFPYWCQEYQTQLENITKIHLISCKMTTLAAEIGYLINLQVLSLPGNQLSTLPSEIGNLLDLRILYLSENQLIILPPEIGNLRKLQELWLHDNNLTTLPTQMGDLKNLQKLNIHDNQLITLPVEMDNLNLQEFTLYNNPFPSIPMALCMNNTDLPRILHIWNSCINYIPSFK